MYSLADEGRFILEEPSRRLDFEEYRTQYRKDYARIIHSPCFRRLIGKTQLFPGKESDFFRNRLTHSLEVAQIAKSIAIRINNRFKAPRGYPKVQINTDLVEIAGLAHDLGHPPFGHQGEAALDFCMREFGGFEGNAQTLRILTKLEKKIVNPESPNGFHNKKDIRPGLNLTYRSLASILKYDNEIPRTLNGRQEYAAKYQNNIISPVKGFYYTESDIVKEIKTQILNYPEKKIKTIECQIMDLADDIAYSTYDLEDGLKAEFYNIFDIIFTDEEIIKNISEKVSQTFSKVYTPEQIRDVLIDLFYAAIKPAHFEDIEINNNNFGDYFLISALGAYKACKKVSNDGNLRTSLTSGLVGQFIRGINFEYNKEEPKLSRVYLNDDIKLKVETLKRFNYESQIQSPRLKIVEFRGKEIVKYIFDILYEGDNFQLMPSDCRRNFELANDEEKPRVICDYIAGMTDNYCIEFYGRLNSENAETIFKPF